MPPPPGPLIPNASRRAKRVIYSNTPTPSPPAGSSQPASEVDDQDEDDAEGEDDDEIDAEGEEEDDEEADDPFHEPDPEPEPANNLRIRLTMKPQRGRRSLSGGAGQGSPVASGSGSGGGTGGVGGAGRPSRAAAADAKRKSRKVTQIDALESEEDDELVNQEIDELDDDEEEPNAIGSDDGMSVDFDGGEAGGSSRRSTSPSKLTARQRAKGNKDLQETLIELPVGMGKKQTLVLTEAERDRKKEKGARKRKRQIEQKQRDDQEQVISRLLRAQTSKSRSKLENEADEPHSTSNPGISTQNKFKRMLNVPKEGMIRYTSSIVEGNVALRVGVPVGKDDWIRLGQAGVGKKSMDVDGEDKKGKARGVCGVGGCGKERIYRSVRKFEVGGCCLVHLKEVEAGMQ